MVIRRCAAQEAELPAAVGEQQGLALVVGDVEALDAVESPARQRSIIASTSSSPAMSQNGCAQNASPPASWIQPIASATVGRVRPA